MGGGREDAPRQQLPINQFEDQILKTVASNSVMVIIGETGSGKTTQLPQILHRAGYSKKGIIAVTQPRRVAAVSVARRVAYEMGVHLGEEVGYSIRFEDRTSSRTSLKYLTDGCLLRECLLDPKLSQYAIIILDEAHERTLNTDILLGLLKCLLRKGEPHLKLVITSATLDGQRISKFFNACPVLTIPGKLFPVQILYSTERPVSCFESAIETAIEIHVREPPGDILLFMTGQEEIEKAISKLEEKIKDLEEGVCMDAILLPLHASLPPELQARVFDLSPSNCRRIIVATNVAETSLTVDGVVYVIDPGFVKQRHYNPSTGMDSLSVVQISRVQAIQRAGRAGRTCPGKCYRLYPSSVYEHEFLPETIPEIQRTSLAGTVLYLKSLELPDLDVLDFDFLDQPSRELLEDALRQLHIIEGIDNDGNITNLGKQMAELPLEPSLARALLAAEEMGCLSQALTVAGMLSCESIFHHNPSKTRTTKQKIEVKYELPTGNGMGDHVQLLQIYEEWCQSNYSLDWCNNRGLQRRSMKYAKDVRDQLAMIMKDKCESLKYSRVRMDSTVEDFRTLRKSLCKGFANRLAHRMTNHNGYRILCHQSQLVQIHPSVCPLEVDADGLLPEWVLYHELIATSRPYIRKVCVVDGNWIKSVLVELETIDIYRLSGKGSNQGSDQVSSLQCRANLETANCTQSEEGSLSIMQEQSKSIDAARARFLARKKIKTSQK
ncbi:hypothetical protein O6H91_23G029200 [Diphasiastrum complanatum]|uniref:Uncharacterized protein n=1 Tax=Diphasiastrum complanatum TaxID=34168 RepID=A0ACC2A965_DIPCM|nr:hypothetical protein O6H91_23G029200 [Diphasiastrum complanatum]